MKVYSLLLARRYSVDFIHYTPGYDAYQYIAGCSHTQGARNLVFLYSNKRCIDDALIISVDFIMRVMIVDA